MPEFNNHWMMEENALAAMLSEKRGGNASINEKIDGVPNRATRLVDENGIAWININGVIYDKRYAGWFSSTANNTNELRELLSDSLNDPNTKAIVFTFDTPGGIAYGIHELANEIYKARDIKPTYSYVTKQAASAGAYLAAAAGEVHLESPASSMGNLGVIRIHEDYSRRCENWGVKITEVFSGRFKRLFSPNKPLSDEGRAALQAETDHFYSLMKSDIALFRGVSEKEAHERLMDGKTFTGDQAVAVGLADAITDRSAFEQHVLKNLSTAASGNSNAAIQNPLTTGRGKHMDINQLAAMDGGQALIDTIKAVARDEGKALGYAEGFSKGMEQGRAACAAEAANASAAATKEAVAKEGQRIKSILALAPRHPQHREMIEAAAYASDKTPGDVLLEIDDKNAETTAKASAAVLNAVVEPIPGTGGLGNPVNASPEKDPKAINEMAKAMIKETPSLTMGEALNRVFEQNAGKP